MKTKEIAITLANQLCEQINKLPLSIIESETNYRRQEVIEELIKELKERV